MRIVHIEIFGKHDSECTFYLQYLTITKEDANYIEVADHINGIEPRGNFLYKKTNKKAAMDGYVSLNMPCWIDCNPRDASAVIYVLEDEIENGKRLLQKALMESIDKQMKRYEALKTYIQNAK